MIRSLELICLLEFAWVPNTHHHQLLHQLITKLSETELSAQRLAHFFQRCLSLGAAWPIEFCLDSVYQNTRVARYLGRPPITLARHQWWKMDHWLVVYLPLWKIVVNGLVVSHLIMENESHVWNHQPDHHDGIWWQLFIHRDIRNLANPPKNRRFSPSKKRRSVSLDILCSKISANTAHPEAHELAVTTSKAGGPAENTLLLCRSPAKTILKDW